MKIAISAMGNTLKHLLDLRFGRCEYFQIYDTEDNEVKIIENKGKNFEGGAGIASAQQLVDEDIDIIITGNLGPNAFKIIEKAGIKVYKSDSISIDTVLGRYKNDELLQIQVAAPAHNGMGRGFRGGI